MVFKKKPAEKHGFEKKQLKKHGFKKKPAEKQFWKKTVKNDSHQCLPALCPTSPQTLHTRCLLAGGDAKVVADACGGGESGVASAGGSQVGEDGTDPGFGTWGNGQTTSWQWGGQYSLMLSYKYHCRSADSPGGVMTGGRSVAEGDQSSLSSLKLHFLTATVLL